jgi:lysyl-tRNA synthetase, class I
VFGLRGACARVRLPRPYHKYIIASSISLTYFSRYDTPMLWVDKIVDQIQKDLKPRIDAGEELVVRDEKTMSGRVHVGSARAMAMHGIFSEVLDERGVKNTFLYEINDFDPMDGLPVYLDQERYREFMGMPFYAIPAPDGRAENFAEYYADEFIEVTKATGFNPHYYRLHDEYKAGKFNEVIRIALERADTIRQIYKEVSGSVKQDDWLPISVVCEKCGKIGTTKATEFDGEKVSYKCEEDAVKWANGCGHSGKISPFDGNAKFPWKVDWAAKFKVFNVAIEGGGKDHFTKGGSRDVANRISKEVFGYDPPFGVFNEFFLVGGKKMSSSKGNAAFAKSIADLLPSHIFRLALLGKDNKQQINFEPEGDTVPQLFDWYDRLAEKAWNGVKDDDTRLFSLIHVPANRGNTPQRYLPRFSIVAYLVQMPHLDFIGEIRKMKGGELTELDIQEADLRAQYALYWLKEYASEEFKFELQNDAPEGTKEFTEVQKNALKEVLKYIEANDELDGHALHTELHEIRKRSILEPKEFFSTIYMSILGKDGGPKAGWFLSVLPKEFLVERLREVSGT